MANEGKTIKISQVKSGIGTKKGHREVLKSLGLRRHPPQVERPDTPAVRGMVREDPVPAGGLRES